MVKLKHGNSPFDFDHSFYKDNKEKKHITEYLKLNLNKISYRQIKIKL